MLGAGTDAEAAIPDAPYRRRRRRAGLRMTLCQPESSNPPPPPPLDPDFLGVGFGAGAAWGRGVGWLGAVLTTRVGAGARPCGAVRVTARVDVAERRAAAALARRAALCATTRRAARILDRRRSAALARARAAAFSSTKRSEAVFFRTTVSRFRSVSPGVAPPPIEFSMKTSPRLASNAIARTTAYSRSVYARSISRMDISPASCCCQASGTDPSAVAACLRGS